MLVVPAWHNVTETYTAPDNPGLPPHGRSFDCTSEDELSSQRPEFSNDTAEISTSDSSRRPVLLQCANHPCCRCTRHKASWKYLGTPRLGRACSRFDDDTRYSVRHSGQKIHKMWHRQRMATSNLQHCTRCIDMIGYIAA